MKEIICAMKNMITSGLLFVLSMKNIKNAIKILYRIK